jgi:hypothetical protein
MNLFYKEMNVLPLYIRPNVKFLLGTSGASAGPGFPGFRLRSIFCTWRKERFAPLQSLALLAGGRLDNKTRNSAY